VSARETRVAVVGGGISGLLAARVLGRHGYECTVVESRAEPTEGGAGLMVWSSALRVLSAQGVEGLEEAGTPVRESILRDHKGRPLLRMPLSLRREGRPRAMPRKVLMKLLLRKVDCPVVHATCVGISDSESEALLRMDDGTELHADHVLVAAGMRTTLRDGARPRHCGRISWRGLVPYHHDLLSGGTSIETLAPGCRIGMFPAGPGMLYWFVQQNWAGGPPPAWSAEAFRDWPAPIPEVLAATDPESVVFTPIDELLPQPPWQQGRVLLIGDAAHGMAPDLGRGACTAIVNLGALDRALARHGSFEDAAREYVRQRRFPSRLIQHASRMAGVVRQLRRPWMAAMRNLLWRFFPPLWLVRRLVTPVVAARLRD
jgi:2-polyprenyl-6-methoxyphenol hydroxylase-like FAD-dependent oxidoreductase